MYFLNHLSNIPTIHSSSSYSFGDGYLSLFTRHSRRRVWISDYDRMIALKNLFDQVVIRETLLTFVV